MASLRVPRSFVIHPLATDQDTLHVFVSLRGARVSLSVKKKSSIAVFYWLLMSRWPAKEKRSLPLPLRTNKGTRRKQEPVVGRMEPRVLTIWIKMLAFGVITFSPKTFGFVKIGSFLLTPRQEGMNWFFDVDENVEATLQTSRLWWNVVWFI